MKLPVMSVGFTVVTLLLEKSHLSSFLRYSALSGKLTFVLGAFGEQIFRKQERVTVARPLFRKT